MLLLLAKKTRIMFVVTKRDRIRELKSSALPIRPLRLLEPFKIFSLFAWFRDL